MTKAENVCPFTLSNDNPPNGKDLLKMHREISFKSLYLSPSFLYNSLPIRLSVPDANVCTYQPDN